ncbi:MAG: peroxidase family protein [Pseudomonadota bacterium]
MARSDGYGASEGRFGRLFALNDVELGNLKPHPSPIYDLLLLGGEGGAMDEGVTPGAPVGDSSIPAGVTFFGQFVDHDVTLDVSTRLDQPAIPEEIENFRTINLDLDCVYGAGPEASPYLYDLPKLVVGTELAPGRNDLPRFNEVALIGDPRNDENAIVSQLQAAFIAFHNAMVDKIIEDDPFLDPLTLTPQEKREVFEEARDNVIHYYHRLLVEDFLPQVIGVNRTVNIAQNGRKYYFPEGFYDNDKARIKRPFMPIEFSVAAYRFGHSQVRQTYTLNENRQDVALFDPSGLMGFKPIEPVNVIDWRFFFPVDDGSGIDPQKARRIDTLLPNHLFRLDEVGVVSPGDEGSLAARNLNRGRVYRLPPGQEIAKWLGEVPIAADLLTETTLAIPSTPLWYYILQESSHIETSRTYNMSVEVAWGADNKSNPIETKGEGSGFGDILGPVGGTIVGEVIAGLIDHYRETTGKGLDYIPSVKLETIDTGKFGQRVQMQHMLEFAGQLP